MYINIQGVSKTFYIIWDVLSILEKFYNLITWPILIQIILNSNSTSRYNSKYYFISKSFWTIVFVFLFFFTFRPLYPLTFLSSPVYLGIEIIQPGKSFLKFSRVESFLCPDKQGTAEEGSRIQRPKCEKNKDDNSLKTLTDSNHQALIQKFRQSKFCV